MACPSCAAWLWLACSGILNTLHAYFLDRLVPVCDQLLAAAAAAGEIVPGQDAYELMRGVGNLCIGADSDPATTRAAWSRCSSQACEARRRARRP